VFSKNMGPITQLHDIVHHAPTFWSCSGVSWITCGLISNHTWLFWEFIYPSEWNHASLLAVRKSWNHLEYCTHLKLSHSFSLCTDVILYGFNLRCFLNAFLGETYEMATCWDNLWTRCMYGTSWTTFTSNTVHVQVHYTFCKCTGTFHSSYSFHKT